MRIFKKKQKMLTDKQKVKRAIPIVVIMLFMIIIVLSISPKRNNDYQTRTDYLTSTMDLTLDSLLNAIGVPDHEIMKTGDITIYNVLPSCPQEDSLQIVATQIQFLSNLEKNISKESKKRLEKYMNDEIRLREEIRKFKSTHDQEIEKVCRRIWFREIDEEEIYTCFQNYEKESNKKHYLNMIMPTGSKNPIKDL